MEFGTFSQTVVITLPVTKHHIACHRKFINMEQNGIWDKDSLFTDGPYLGYS